MFVSQSSRDVLLAFSRDYLRGEGDLTRHLGYFGYTVSHVQSSLDEYNYAVTNLAGDLRDGLRLTSVPTFVTLFRVSVVCWAASNTLDADYCD